MKSLVLKIIIAQQTVDASTKRFKDKVAIVTGAGQGIGYAICKQLIAEGARVILNDVDGSLAERAAQELSSGTGACIAKSGDVASSVFIKELVRDTVAQFGRLDIAIANAGITLFGDFLTYRPDALYQVLNTNIGGSFFLAQESAKQMIKQQQGGSILFMSSVTGHQAHKNLAAYAMTKAALEMLAKNLVIEISEYNITVNAVAPGATLTERTETDSAYLKTWSTITPLKKPATPGDIAHAAVFLVSNDARHITGQTLVIDGGWTSISPSPY